MDKKEIKEKLAILENQVKPVNQEIDVLKAKLDTLYKIDKLKKAEKLYKNIDLFIELSESHTMRCVNGAMKERCQRCELEAIKEDGEWPMTYVCYLTIHP